MKSHNRWAPVVFRCYSKRTPTEVYGNVWASIIENNLIHLFALEERLNSEILLQKL